MNPQDSPLDPVACVTAWLLARRPELHKLDPDLDLIENRVIDSLSVPEFLLLIEEVTGRRIDLARFDAGSLRTLRTLERDLLRSSARHE